MRRMSSLALPMRLAIIVSYSPVAMWNLAVVVLTVLFIYDASYFCDEVGLPYEQKSGSSTAPSHCPLRTRFAGVRSVH